LSCPLGPPGRDYDVLYRAHRDLRLRTRCSEELWEASHARRDEVWARARALAESRNPAAPDLADVANQYLRYPVWFVKALRDAKTSVEIERVLAKLEGLHVHDAQGFAIWAARLIDTVEAQKVKGADQALTAGENGLLYEIALEELQKADGRWSGAAPLPSVRVAALLRYHLEEAPILKLPDAAGLSASRWAAAVALWRRYDEAWALQQLPQQPVFRLVLVPGLSGADHVKRNDASALVGSRGRADRAVKELMRHLDDCPDGECVAVLASGGPVRSQSSEADIIASALQNPATWPGGVVPSQLVGLRDDLSRHTSNNLRAAGQMALRLGLRGFRVVTSPGHALSSLQTAWLKRYRREARWGLSPRERNLMAPLAPMVRQGCGPGSTPGEGRVVFGEVMPSVFIPAIGDALNP